MQIMLQSPNRASSELLPIAKRLQMTETLASL